MPGSSCRDAALCWREIQTHIKGSLDAATGGRGQLDRTAYLKLSDLKRESSLAREHREVLFEMYR